MLHQFRMDIVIEVYTINVAACDELFVQNKKKIKKKLIELSLFCLGIILHDANRKVFNYKNLYLHIQRYDHHQNHFVYYALPNCLH